MDQQTIDDAIERVKNSPRVGLPARLAAELQLLEYAAANRFITWTAIAEKLGVSKSHLSDSRKNAKRLYANVINSPEPSSKPTTPVSVPEPVSKTKASAAPAQTQQPMPPASPIKKPSSADEVGALMKARFKEMEKAEAEAREKAKNEEPELDEESRGLLDMFENSGKQTQKPKKKTLIDLLKEDDDNAPPARAHF